jgi:hypothetical protein
VNFFSSSFFRSSFLLPSFFLSSLLPRRGIYHSHYLQTPEEHRHKSEMRCRGDGEGGRVREMTRLSSLGRAKKEIGRGRARNQRQAEEKKGREKRWSATTDRQTELFWRRKVCDGSSPVHSNRTRPESGNARSLGHSCSSEMRANPLDRRPSTVDRRPLDPSTPRSPLREVEVVVTTN